MIEGRIRWFCLNSRVGNLGHVKFLSLAKNLRVFLMAWKFLKKSTSNLFNSKNKLEFLLKVYQTETFFKSVFINIEKFFSKNKKVEFKNFQWNLDYFIFIEIFSGSILKSDSKCLFPHIKVTIRPKTRLQHFKMKLKSFDV